MGVVHVVDQSEALTGSAPTASTEGVSLHFAKSYRIVVSAPVGQTLSGAGTLQAYFYSPNTGWARDPDQDLTLSVSGSRSQVFSDVLVGPPMGRLRYVGNGITVSSGSAVNVHYELGD
jgi:hypothetical protein